MSIDEEIRAINEKINGLPPESREEFYNRYYNICGDRASALDLGVTSKEFNTLPKSALIKIKKGLYDWLKDQ